MRLIDADEFRELIDGGYDLNFDDVPNTKKELLRMIDDAPTVDAVERKQGKWVDGYCSECGCDVPAYIIDWKWQKDMDAKFCPMCGADMRGEANETD